jgi:hypothetical protein
MIRRLRIVWRRARRTGRDLDAAAYAAGIVGGVIFLAAMTGVLGPTLDTQRHHRAGAERHAAR